MRTSNYGTLAAAADGLGGRQLPNQPEPRHLRTAARAPTATAPAYLYDWDPAAKDFLVRED